MKLFCKIFVLFNIYTSCTSFNNIYAQTNLISNGYFEIIDSCPPGILVPNDSYLADAVGWRIGSLTPDLFNACSNSNNNVPHAALGYQKDCCNGNGFSGEYVFYKNSFGNDQREYIFTQLSNSLESEHKYIASIYVSNSDYWNNALSTIGMLFTDTATILPSGQGFIQANPQIVSHNLLSDTLNWMLIQDTFISVGNEIFMTIGNFNTDATSGIVSMSGEAYYYIDGVSLYDITNGSCNNFWDAGFDKYITEGDSIRLGAINTDNSSYIWVNSIGGTTYLNSNIDARPWSKPNTNTTYYVTKTCPNNNVFRDTVTVYVQQITGIKRITNNPQFNLYPNPSSDNVTINYDIVTDAVIEITDVTGNLVGTYNLPVSGTIIQIKNDNLPSGVYMYRIIGNNTVIKLGKIVIIK
jgi:hypothetical protein